MRGQIKIHLGCGATAPEGWINLDSSFRVWLDKVPGLRFLGYEPRFPTHVRRWDAKHGLPFEDGSASHVYSSHMIEHLPKPVFGRLLRECHRVLAPGGRIRLITPNVRVMAENYFSRLRTETLSQTAADHFAKSLLVFPEGEESLFLKWLRCYQGRKNLHQWLYDEKNLTHALAEAGFVNIVSRHDWLSDFPDLHLLESEDYRQGSVCAEATAAHASS